MDPLSNKQVKDWKCTGVQMFRWANLIIVVWWWNKINSNDKLIHSWKVEGSLSIFYSWAQTSWRKLAYWSTLLLSSLFDFPILVFPFNRFEIAFWIKFDLATVIFFGLLEQIICLIFNLQRIRIEKVFFYKTTDVNFTPSLQKLLTYRHIIISECIVSWPKNWCFDNVSWLALVPVFVISQIAMSIYQLPA